MNAIYCQTSDKRHTLIGNKIVDQLECSWSIAYRRCSNYIFILDLTCGFNGLGKDNCKMRQKNIKFGVAYIRGLMVVMWFSRFMERHDRTDQG